MLKLSNQYHKIVNSINISEYNAKSCHKNKLISIKDVIDYLVPISLIIM